MATVTRTALSPLRVVGSPTTTQFSTRIGTPTTTPTTSALKTAALLAEPAVAPQPQPTAPRAWVYPTPFMFTMSAGGKTAEEKKPVPQLEPLILTTTPTWVYVALAGMLAYILLKK